jgi:hypothetical protein
MVEFEHEIIGGFEHQIIEEANILIQSFYNWITIKWLEKIKL